MTNTSGKYTSKELELELQQTINLPKEVQVLSFLGRGRRSFSYKGKFENVDVVIKIYRKEFIQKYIDKCNIDIAKLEFERNSTLYKIGSIQDYIATPFKVFPQESDYTHSFVQEYIEGVTLKKLISKLGYLPNEVLNAGYEIVKTAEAIGVHDLDISVGNILAVNKDGVWAPKLYDFNMLPQYMNPPNPLMALGFKFGMRKKSHRDYRSLKNWERRGKQKHWLGKN